MHAKDVANASEGVLDLSAPLTLFAIGGHLAITQNLSITLAGLCILIFTGASSLWEGSYSVLISWPSSVTWDWAEPDLWLWCEVILWAWLHDQVLEPQWEMVDGLLPHFIGR